jgi:hypothetical protein
MLQMESENGPLFQPEEHRFLDYLIQHNRILLFKQAAKEDRERPFVPSQE